MTNKAVVVLSGGLDSTTLMYHVASQGYEVHAISFRYGQRHVRELTAACRVVDKLYDIDSRDASGRFDMAHDDHHKIIDLELAGVAELFEGSGSALVTGEDVPEGHYAEENMKATVVPNRNMIMLSIAAAWAISIEAEGIWTGVHAGDHFIYPDCRPGFIRPANAAIVRGNAGFGKIADWNENVATNPQDFIFTPFIKKSKNDIAQMAFDLDVPIEETWSCYKGGDMHCGRCGTCVERLEALASADGVDPTPYADSSFWKGVTSHV